MFNPYSIILGLFILSGVVVTLWGVRVIVVARRTLQWPCVGGKIEESKIDFGSRDLLPHIVFSYSVEGKEFRQNLKFPADVTPSQEYSKSYVDRYPAGFLVQVYYNPDNPEDVTLEPGPGKDDWLIMAIGLGMLILGILMFFFAA